MIELKRVKLRRKTGFIPDIIINHSIDFNRKNTINTEKLLDTTKADFWSIRKLSRDELNYEHDAFNLLVEKIGKYYQTIMGCPLYARNPFINDLVDNDVLDIKYRDSILITIHGDYSFDILDKKLADELAYRILELKNLFNVPVLRINFLDELVDYDKNDKLKNPFNLKKMTKIEKSNILLYMLKFGK